MTVEKRSAQGKADVRLAIVASKYNDVIVDRLLRGCLRTLKASGVPSSDIVIHRVPGAFEIPVVARHLAESKEIDAVIALGAIVRGETPHFEYIASACSQGLSSISLQTGKPVILGVLTVEEMQQALDRSGDSESNKGSEAASSALDTIAVIREIHGDP